MNPKTSDNLGLTKAEIRKYTRHTMRDAYPEEAGKVTDKLILQCVIYMEGYCDAMSYGVEEPVNHEELKTFLLGVAYDYILRHIL